MDLDTFIVAVFCEVEDWLESQRPPRQRGPKPKLSDSEVLTIEAVGEFLGIDTDQGLYTFFGGSTPSGSRPCRRSTAQHSHARWLIYGLSRTGCGGTCSGEFASIPLSLVDSFSVPVWRFACC